MSSWYPTTGLSGDEAGASVNVVRGRHREFLRNWNRTDVCWRRPVTGLVASSARLLVGAADRDRRLVIVGAVTACFTNLSSRGCS
jgi:hypothetical protein